MKKSSLGKEFKAFISRGNVMDLAVGVIIGAAFQKIVTSLVNDIIMPAVGLLLGGVNFGDHFWILKLPEGVSAAQVTSLSVAQSLGVTTLNYGSFLSSVLDFFILALVVFFLVRYLNKLRRLGAKPQPVEAVAPKTKCCPYCKSEISIEATRCPHCTSQLDGPAAP